MNYTAPQARIRKAERHAGQKAKEKTLAPKGDPKFLRREQQSLVRPRATSPRSCAYHLCFPTAAAPIRLLIKHHQPHLTKDLGVVGPGQALAEHMDGFYGFGEKGIHMAALVGFVKRVNCQWQQHVNNGRGGRLEPTLPVGADGVGHAAQGSSPPVDLHVGHVEEEIQLRVLVISKHLQFRKREEVRPPPESPHQLKNRQQ